MEKQELLKTVRSLNLRKGDRLEVELTETNWTFKRQQNVIAQFDGLDTGTVYWNRHGERKANATWNGSSKRLATLIVTYEKNGTTYVAGIPHNEIESVKLNEIPANHNKRRSNPYSKIENYA